ncbi:MAG: hypothetical protein KGO05_15815 [Chloroflexota bacterium]|nr:hypothetical protein [Chloroflexota bacterium]
MAKATRSRSRRNRLSLSLRFSVLMLLAALLPLVVVVGVNDYFARQTLIKQSSDALTADANANASRIDDYIRERLLDGVALSSLDTAPKFLICAPQEAAAQAAIAQGLFPTNLSADCAANFTSYGQSVGRALFVGTKRDANYVEWNLFLPNGLLLLSSNPATQKAGLTLPKGDVAAVVGGHQWVSGVYYDTAHKYAYVRLYTPIFATFPNQGGVQGFMTATLKLDKVWSIVAQERSANGAGSMAFITDQNGIRIATSDSADLFTAVQPLDAQTQGVIATNKLYGATGQVPVVALPNLSKDMAGNAKVATFQASEVGEAPYQFVGEKLTSLPWTYFAASPIATITAVATDQERTSIISAAVVAVLAALIGLFIGSRTAGPVERSANDLEGAAVMLKALAARQENSASEQHWVVDACKTGLDGVRYLTDAMNQAAKRIVNASNWFNDYWNRLTEEQVRATVQHLRELAAYIDEAARRQQASSDRLDKAIAVTMQVSEQLMTGATEATQSAAQLEQVVRDLQHVIGGRHSAAAEASAEAESMQQVQRRMEAVTGKVPAISAPANEGYMLPPAGRSSAPSSGRLAPRAPQQPWGNPSQLGGEDWGAYGGQNGAGVGNGNSGYSQYGGQNRYDQNQW